MSRLAKDTLKASSSAQEDLGEASINDMVPVEPLVVLLPETPATTPEKKKNTLPSPNTPCVKFSSQRLHQLASARRYQYHSLDEKELHSATNRQSTPLEASEPQSPSPASSTTKEETMRGPDMVALRRLGERRERLGRLRRQQSAPDPRFSSTLNEQKLSSTAQPHAVKVDAEDAPTPSGPFLPSPGKNNDFKTANRIRNESSTKTPGKSNRFDVERCQELQAHRAKYHYGATEGALESHMQAKVKKIESIPLISSPQARQLLVELGRTRPTTNSPFALQSYKSFGYHRANSSRMKSVECSSLLHLGHLMNGTKPAEDEDNRGSEVPLSHPRGHDFEDSATADWSVWLLGSVPSQRGGRSRLFLLACLAVGYTVIMRSGLWACREIYHSHFCPGESDSGPRSCVRPNRRIRDKQSIATPRGSENFHSIEGYVQGTPRSLGGSLWDRIESYVEECLQRLARVPEAVPEKETKSSRSKESRPKSSSRRRGGRPKSIVDQNLSLKSWNATSQAESNDFEFVSILSWSANKVSLPCRNRVNISSRIVPQRLAYRKRQAWTAASFASDVALQCGDDQDENALSMGGGFCPAQIHDGNFNADMVSKRTDRDLQNTTSSEEQAEYTFVPPGIKSGFSRDGWNDLKTPWIADGVSQVNTDFFLQASAHYVIQSARDTSTAEKRVDQHPLANAFTRFGEFLRKQQDRVDQILHQLRTIEMDKVEALFQI